MYSSIAIQKIFVCWEPNLKVYFKGNLSLLEPSWPVQACNWITLFQVFKVCEVKSAMFTAPRTYDTDKADEDTQLELVKLQYASFLKEKFTDIGV
jgi:hypothetical protein